MMNPLKNVTSPTVIQAHSGVPRAGQLIGDRYRLDRPLERGAMGSVWCAEQVRLRAPVAVKFLDPSLIGDKEMHDRFIQEARSAAAVRSAHVVQVFDYGSEGGVPYIAMELLDGENLDSRLGARGTLTPAELSKLFSELARGISQAHAIGVIHRDLKPGNIFLAREGEHEVTKIVDFGIAKVKASALRLTQGIGTQLGTLLGTPQYMSPEQVRGASSIDHRTDLWALAVIACECLTGRCPFSGATIGDLTVQICTERPAAPSSLGNVPAGFDQWFFKATQKKPSKRFQSVEEMAERLQAVLGPAVLAAPNGARAGRLITFPSRSEVRLAYSAVVTWKGYVMSRLGDTWMDLRRLMLRVGHYLAIRYEVAQQRFDELLESERLAFLRPVIERHGMVASVALLCCGVLLLGLTTRGGEPNAASAGPANAPAPVVATPAPRLAGVAPVSENSEAPADTQAPNVVASATAPSVASPGALASAAPAASAQDVQAPGRALDDFVVPMPASANAGPDDAPAPAIATSAFHLEPSPRAARNDAEPRERASASPAAQKPSRPEAPAPSKKSKPITKAMAQAATKILNADDLVASVPAKKAPAPATTPPRPVRRPSNTQAKGTDAFDDRL
jgi:hypothetical protein